MRDLSERYLRLLGFDRPPSGLEGLRALVRAHIYRVPFENVSKLLLFDRERSGRLTTLAEFLDGIESLDTGGTCFTSNPFLACLLSDAGYDADLLGADMNSANVHTVVRVRDRGKSYHIDAGYGAPFLEPVLIERLPWEIGRGKLRWIFDVARDGRIQLQTFQDSQLVHGYSVNEQPRQHEFFRDTIVDSFERGRTFMSLLRLVRIFPTHTVELKDRKLTVHRDGESRETMLHSMSGLRQAIDHEFQLPRCPVEKAVSVLEEINGMDFFADRLGQGTSA
jgi:N-hydroxyarylamine O-acetyltransferase